MRGLVGVVLGTCCAIVIACSGGQRATMAPQPPQTNVAAPLPPRPSDPRADQIDTLVAQIDQQRGEMNLPEQHGERTSGVEPRSTAMAGGTAPPVAPTCEQPKGQSDNCKQSCTLKTSICENAKKICDIAGEMAGDEWAAQKCADGNATCDAARKKCCECMP
jgi:hypothetical protein